MIKELTRNAVEWSVPIGNLGEWQLTLDGGVVAMLDPPTGGPEVVSFDSHGVETQRCPYSPSAFLGLVNGRLFLSFENEVRVYDAPGADIAPTGWATSTGHAGNTHRPR